MRFFDFAELLTHYARTTPEAPALRYERAGRVETMDYLTLLTTAEARSEALRRSGCTCLGVFTDGTVECVLTIFGAVLSGIQVVLLDEDTPEEKLPALLEYTDVDRLWGDVDLVESLTPTLHGGVKDGAGKLLFFTSGTTSQSKAVVLTERSLCASAYNGGALLPLESGDVLLCQLPLCHVFGFVCGLLWGLSCGACVALGRGRRHYLDDCALFRPTALAAVPLLLGFLLRQQALNPGLRLVLVGAGDCPASLLEDARATGARVSFGYGLTETSSGVALSLGDEPYAMTVCPDDTITLAEDGEILVYAPTCLMQGYYKRPIDTDIAIQTGVLRTGDLGVMDDKGLLHVIGRKKDVLVLPDGTKQFLPECEGELAALLGGGDFALVLHRGRVALALYGDERSDEQLWRCLAPYQAARPRGQQIAAILRQTQPLPRTATGKVKRWELKGRIGYDQE